jgi:hypothetical protein
MIVDSPLDSAAWWTSASNVLYITGAIFTALTAAWIVYETRAVALGKHQKFFLLSEILGAFAAIICVLGSIGAIYFGNTVSHLKDVALEAYKASAGVQIAQAQKDSAVANGQAAKANERAGNLEAEAARIENENLQLQLQLSERTKPLVARRLTAKQIGILATGLAGSGLRISVLSTGSDLEVNNFAADFTSALNQAQVLGATVSGGSMILNGVTVFPNGVNIAGPDGPQKTLLESLLRKAAIPFGSEPLRTSALGVELAGGGLQILIGPRPDLPK